MDKYEEIAYIVGTDLAPSWFEQESKIYLLHGEPYGIMSTQEIEGITYIMSAVVSPEKPFTKGMITDIIKLYRKKSICLITDDINYHEHMKTSLSRYNFEYIIEDNLLLSYHKKEQT